MAIVEKIEWRSGRGTQSIWKGGRERKPCGCGGGGSREDGGRGCEGGAGLFGVVAGGSGYCCVGGGLRGLKRGERGERGGLGMRVREGRVF